ncbi:ricin-type beta-trefoil lectin domain protein [Luteibacter sp. E-22]|uniref:ricin-type beta-trefoil lectin domain protein n=1 Tax=Luteibacter sp. E-22 TaxID=3404050 RepID=UPI003CEE9948
MRIPTLAIRSLTLAIGFGLAFHSAASDLTAVSTRLAASTKGTNGNPALPPSATLVVFGSPIGPSRPDNRGAATMSAASLLSDDIDRLSSLTPGDVLAVLDTDVLPLAEDQAVSLKRLFDAGVPVLLQSDGQAPAAPSLVTSLFGIAPTAGDALFHRNADGGVEVFTAPAGQEADVANLLSAMMAGMPRQPDPAEGGQYRLAAGVEADVAEGAAVLPARHFDVNFVDPSGEILGVTGIDVVRSRTRSTDLKLVTLTSKVSVKPKRAGIVDGGRDRKNLWGAYLPLKYRLQHNLAMDGVTPTYLDHFPVTDGRTEYTQVDTESRGFTVGGSTGTELSSTGKPDDVLASKVPFNLSFGYEHKWQTSLSMTFNDYSMLAAPVGPGSVSWEALIAPKLVNVLIKRWGADLPQLTEEKMTPMMRAAAFNTLSQWKLPGDYEGMAKVTVSGGYDLDRKEWWWERTNVRHGKGVDTRSVFADFVLDMSDPYLSAEITVLIRSATGSGACLRDNQGSVGLAPCNATDRRQMWGLDASSRYVNRGSLRCLSVQPATRSVITDTCENIAYEKQWQWRADRLHSLMDHGNYRLYVEGGAVHYHAPAGRFQDYPVNPYGSPLEPWTNYPNSPRPGIDVQPAPLGNRPLEIGPEWASFQRVGDDQRWRVEILRMGL